MIFHVFSFLEDFLPETKDGSGDLSINTETSDIKDILNSQNLFKYKNMKCKTNGLGHFLFFIKDFLEKHVFMF